MKARYDGDLIELTDGFMYAIELLMKENVAMMKAGDPEYAGCWYWGRCEIRDMSSSGAIRFFYGGIEDMPDDGGGQFALIVAT